MANLTMLEVKILMERCMRGECQSVEVRELISLYVADSDIQTLWYYLNCEKALQEGLELCPKTFTQQVAAKINSKVNLKSSEVPLFIKKLSPKKQQRT